MDSVIERSTKSEKFSQFALTWNVFCTKVLRELTLHSAPSFGSFHLLHILADDYVKYKLDSMREEKKMKDYNQALITGCVPEKLLPTPKLMENPNQPRDCNVEWHNSHFNSHNQEIDGNQANNTQWVDYGHSNFSMTQNMFNFYDFDQWNTGVNPTPPSCRHDAGAVYCRP